VTSSGKQLEFLRHLFNQGFDGARFKSVYYKRADLMDEYEKCFQHLNGFPEVHDILLFQKMLSRKSSQSGILVEYSLTRAAIDNLAALSETEIKEIIAWRELPASFVLTKEKRQYLVSLLSKAERDLDEIGAGNAEKALARAYIVAAKSLADAPDPPSDLIWEIINRANQLSGIASILVSIIALFASVR
jgi:hypothetical protein